MEGKGHLYLYQAQFNQIQDAPPHKGKIKLYLPTTTNPPGPDVSKWGFYLLGSISEFGLLPARGIAVTEAGFRPPLLSLASK